ncbi:cysteine protease ATG4B-like [Dysidea avara]|uniref:cysteine protease ATG4B-like n=1 Tax=Dysidea avara TaxID=196820 RepID=UPI0033185D1A
MAANTLSYDNVVPGVSEPPAGKVMVLGRLYQLPQDLPTYLKDIQSKIWCTYRKYFKAISGSSYTSDAGWGCTLRCGQMLLAQAIVCKQLGRDWRWSPKENDPVYMKILSQFLDISTSDYSLHLIALQGVDLGRPLGHWFGPNNMAQVIKKLAVHDKWNELVVHVAMDMLVVMDDMVTECRRPHHSHDDFEYTLESSLSTPSANDHLVTMQLHMKKNTNRSHHQECSAITSRPVLLLVPLRLGQDHFNMQYAGGLKACFDLPQSVGVIGGKPRHALWFIGYKGDQLVYLDPHTTQPMVHPQDLNHIPDTSYHCHSPGYMKISDIDPSIALGFICSNEKELHELCSTLKSKVLSHTPAMFEIIKERPPFWDQLHMDGESVSDKESFLMVEPTNSDDEGFEIIEWSTSKK